MITRMRHVWFELVLLFAAWKLETGRKVRRALGLRRTNFHSVWTIRHLDAMGRTIWGETAHNMLHDEGEEFMLDVVFTETQSVPASYYIGLDDRTLAEDDTLADLTNEPSGSGYARQAVASNDTDFTLTQASGEDGYRATTSVETFTANGGAWGEVDNAFLCTVISGTSGKLIASVALSTPRTLQNGESLQVSMYIKLSE